MLVTNIILGIIAFMLILIHGGICNIDSKLLNNAEYLRLKKLSNNYGPIITKVKDEKET